MPSQTQSQDVEMSRYRRGQYDSDDPPGDDVELLRARSSGDAKPAQSRTSPMRWCMALSAGIITVVMLAHGFLAEWHDASELKLVTWNIAAINNNPFEYWITHEDAAYNQLMVDVQEFISSPGERDVPVARVFTPQMWTELKDLMTQRGWSGVNEVEALWTSDFSQRRIISGFMKDKALGEKRLAS